MACHIHLRFDHILVKLVIKIVFTVRDKVNFIRARYYFVFELKNIGLKWKNVAEDIKKHDCSFILEGNGTVHPRTQDALVNQRIPTSQKYY